MRPLLALLTCLLSLSAFGQFLHEPFDYAPKNPIWCSGGGTGWIGEWSRETGDDAIYEANDLDTIDNETGTHALLPFELAGMRYNRRIPLIADEGQTVWMSVWMKFAEGANPNNVGNVTFTRNGNQVFTIGRKFGNQKFGFVWPGAGNYNTDVDTEGLHWVVARIEFSGNNAAESVWLWIDPIIDGTTPPDDASANLMIDASSSPSLRLNTGIDGVQLKNEGTPPLFMGLDELLLGNTFLEVAPMLTSTTTPTTFFGELTVLGNPVADQLTYRLRLPGTQRLQARIVDASGRTVYASPYETLGAGAHEMQVPVAFPAGLYLLQLTDGQAAQSVRFVVR